MTVKRRRKGKAKTVEQGMGGVFADVAALSAMPDRMRAVSSAPAAAVDLDKYRRHVAHLDMPEDRKSELLHALWTMMGSFVDRAFGDDPVQHCRSVGDKSSAEDESAPAPVVKCSDDPDDPDNDLSSTFRHRTEPRGRRKR